MSRFSRGSIGKPAGAHYNVLALLLSLAAAKTGLPPLSAAALLAIAITVLAVSQRFGALGAAPCVLPAGWMD